VYSLCIYIYIPTYTPRTFSVCVCVRTVNFKLSAEWEQVFIVRVRAVALRTTKVCFRQGSLNTQPLITYTACNLRIQTKNLSGSDGLQEHYGHNPLKTYVSFNNHEAMFASFEISQYMLFMVRLCFRRPYDDVFKKCNTAGDKVLENASRRTFLSIAVSE